ncbi:unnamed protein product [Urochloa decumbens]|uniref:CW-type domain-containing protein n=1 Tax=Urochloa decumbens TaxID=240449 RepID=A0ABC9EP88_9POAL
MLSVRRRQEDAPGRSGVTQLRGGMDGDAELEEGEACGDDTAFVDPDVALSYIDEKLQDVLGHFQKDFEGGVSAENLGSKFGGYGSFLPTYQRSPLPQTRSPPKAANVTSKSPFHQSSEGTSQNTSAVAVPSVPQNNGSVVPFPGDSSKKEMHSITKAERGSGPSGSHDSYGPSKSSDQNRFKVRIKVGSDNVLARNNAAIYSGLGLDISSPSSVEDSPDGCGSLSPEVNNVPYESPRTILQIMTCFEVPGGFLLSPLPANILRLTKRVVASSKKWEANVDMENVQATYEGHVAKKVKSDGKKKKVIDAKNSKSRNDVSAVMKKDIDIETVAGQKIVSEALNIALLSDSRAMEAKGENRLEDEPTENNLGGNKDSRLKERAIKSDSSTIRVEPPRAEATECLENSSFGSSEMDVSAAKGELKPRTEKGETILEERNTTNDKNLMLDRKQENKIKPESKCNASNYEGNNIINDRSSAVSRSTGKVPGKETLSYDTNGENSSKSEAKKMQREQKANALTSSDFLEDEKHIHSSAAVKERKSEMQSKSSHTGKKPKSKSHRDARDSLPEGSYAGKEQDTLENGSGFGDPRPKEKSWKNDSERDSDVPVTSRREISSSVKHDRHAASEEQKMHIPPPATVSTANAAPTLPAPVVIEEHWVACDICQKWRLLPYEMNPSSLPKKWKCSMLHWLPGMNRCEISEEETTNALNALYVIPAPANGIPSAVHPHVASAGLVTSGTSHLNGHVEHSRKRKNALSDGTFAAEGSHLTQASVHPMNNQHAPSKSKSYADGGQYPIERDSVSKLVDPTIEKKKSKSKHRSTYPDGGDPVERSKKHSKVKSKRDMDHDEHKASKKIRKEERRHFDRDRNPGFDLASGDVPDEAKALPAKIATSKGSGERSDVSSSKQKNVSRHNRLENSKKARQEDVVVPEDENKEYFHQSDVQRSDLSSKKRIVKEWEESQYNSVAHASKGATANHSSAIKETYKEQNLKEAKLKSLKSEELFSTTDSRPGKIQHADQISSYDAGHMNSEFVEDNTLFSGKRGPPELENNLCDQALDLGEPAPSDVAYVQTAAVTSSSSKASGSQKKKHSNQAMRTSPIESLSSSPQRNSNTDKVSHSRILGKDGSLNANSSTIPSMVKQLNTEVSAAGNDQRSSEPVSVGRRKSDNGQVQLTQGHASDGIHFERGSNDDLQHESGRKDSNVKGSHIPRGSNHLHSGDKYNHHTDGSPMQPGKHTVDSKTSVLDTKGDLSMHENKKSTNSLQDRNGSIHCPPDGNPLPGLPSGKEKSYLKSNKQDSQKPKPQMVCSPPRESKFDSHSTPPKPNGSKLTPQVRQYNAENGGRHGTAKQAIPSPAHTASPARKDNTSTAYALKEARDLKHKANRLKEEGKELESTRLYFEAALKFLHVASLLEPPSFDGSKQGDAAQSMYSDTAKLCNFVGHAYEKCKKMAAAALAYKCVEVAYLKAAYYKYPTASKDRQVLQAVVQTAPGESPSSSASDIDNLNNNGLSKGSSSKDANSPQVAGNHLLLAARNQPHLMRLLAYTNDVNSAFEATRKSQLAIASAAGNHENGTDGLSSVRTVLDFNFRSVNDLLRLVRISMESISC